MENENENQDPKENQNNVSIADELAAIKAREPSVLSEAKDLLRAEEKTAKAEVLSKAKELEEAMATKDARIAELQAEGEALRAERGNLQARVTEFESQRAESTTQLEGKTKELEASAAELATVNQAKGEAVAKYLGLAKALNPTIPEGIVVGETIAEIEQSVEKGKAIVEAVRKAMESEAAATKVPAGAPTRGEISLEGLSPREKIAAGIQQKGGTS